MSKRPVAKRQPRRKEEQLDLFADSLELAAPCVPAVQQQRAPEMCGDRWLETGSPWTARA